MNISEWPDGAYPIYLNPDFEDILKLAEHQWDTLRILFSEDVLIIGSGHGNTHETLARAYRNHLKARRTPYLEAAIIHFSGHKFYLDIDGDDHVLFEKRIVDMPDKWQPILRDAIRERDNRNLG